MSSFEKLHSPAFPFVFKEEIYFIKEAANKGVPIKQNEIVTKEAEPLAPAAVLEEEMVTKVPIGETTPSENKPYYKGKCAKGIIIAIQDKEGLREEDKDFLKSVLASKKLELTDVGLLNLSGLEKLSIKKLRLPDNLQLFIAFGIKGTMIDAVLPYQKYSAEQGENDCIFIKADSLKDISLNRELKVSLWNQLKPLSLA